MNFELKEKYYKNMILQRDKEENERFKHAMKFQKNFINIEKDLTKNKELFKLKEEIKSYKQKIDTLQYENNYLKNKIRYYENKFKIFKNEIQIKNKNISYLISENDVINRLYQQISQHIFQKV
ncbi:conserved Plasmodium protein, unknown function [Plasmodium reichenowi]|uniref:Uncharacterized protein n=13 Tax=Plasmodium (Laverania) TaxID=418107 RepID=C6KSR1_PLAF7|nr:hypothetical protein PRSY57_0604900 [Plasmodium reichenowi]XP_966053.1 conserved Plasmodium protein, unknown function [Plasmodium falciparum 3D7]ETW19828.1 hypothetical protein PFFVO_01303 [Plasmodium falciparum Vietnam Oak-Knoll (FVO)]ETW37928.1 hypothetical protein PFTANZ_01359 [Plasmodium falciparum Tanzania (2000708)]ETW53292.1 hypothetical protein PFUGPA_04919 [Plasmodium falciparum Palo Alto/Uganda]ETW62803.1 hypothetical protein PFMC_01323 [Plasmodium falciparum CAMP/Malaysia]EUR755|eukprot:XP_966053.1 conserved Plasmodium protein, unknown function [Plasmodium falciparum 3D7]